MELIRPGGWWRLWKVVSLAWVLGWLGLYTYDLVHTDAWSRVGRYLLQFLIVGGLPPILLLLPAGLVAAFRGARGNSAK